MTKILIVEDEAITALDIQHRLKSSGYEVVETVSSGEKAIKKVKELEPDLILMDIVLRGKLDGIETADKIKTFFDVPIVYMSAFSDESIFERIRLTAPYGFVNKPVSSELLLISINAALYKHELDKKLVESEERLRTVFDSSKNLMYCFDLKWRFVSANKNLCNIMHLNEGEITGKTLQELGFSKKRCDNVYKFFKEALKTDSTVSYFSTVPMPDGKIHDYEVILNPLHDIHGKISGISGISIDLTEHKKLKKEFDEVDEIFQNMYSNATFGVIIGDIDGQVITCNYTFEKMVGYTEEELKSLSFLKYTHPADIGKERPLARNLRDGKVKFYEIEKRFVRKDKKIIWVKVTAGFGVTTNGKLINSLVIVEDITERKQTEKEMKEYISQLDAIFGFSNIAMVVMDKNGRWVKLNDYFLNELGYTEQELLKLNCRDITHPEDIEKSHELFSKLLSGETGSYRLKKRYKTKEGKFKWFDLSVTSIKCENNEITSFILAGYSINV